MRSTKQKFLPWISLLLLATFSHLQTPVFAQKKFKLKPASENDIYLYRGIGASHLCNARLAGIEFPKAVGIASATYAQVLKGRHEGIVASAGKKKLTDKQLFAGAEFQIITGALQYCPKEVPDNIAAKVREAINKKGSGGNSMASMNNQMTDMQNQMQNLKQQQQMMQFQNNMQNMQNQMQRSRDQQRYFMDNINRQRGYDPADYN
tara:strand:+ start:42 stop:659 length:618 start_codon:yes stop_codon:yes gene_type:complete